MGNEDLDPEKGNRSPNWARNRSSFWRSHRASNISGFSDVTSIEGCRRASGSLFRTIWAEIYAKNTEPVKAHYFLHILFGLNRSVFENKRFKRYFLKRLTRAPWEMRIWIRKKAIGAQIEPGIPHVLGIGIYPDSRVVWHFSTSCDGKLSISWKRSIALSKDSIQVSTNSKKIQKRLSDNYLPDYVISFWMNPTQLFWSVMHWNYVRAPKSGTVLI